MASLSSRPGLFLKKMCDVVFKNIFVINHIKNSILEDFKMSVLLFIVPLFAIGLTLTPMVPILNSAGSGCSVKNRFLLHFCMFFGIFLLTAIVLFAMGMTASAATASSSAQGGSDNGLRYIGAALSTGIASIGAGFGVGGAAPAAIGACSENPKSFVKAMIFVVLGEGLAIYGLVISFLILFAK